MIITNYNDIDVQQWQRLVETSPTATWFQTPEAYRFFASLPEMMTPFVFAVTAQPHSELVSESPIIQDETAAWEPTADVTQDAVINNDSHSNPFHLKGIVVGYITREKSHVKQFFTRRAIIYGGPLLAEDITEEELKSLLFALCSHLNKKAIYIETRNFNDFSRWRPVFEQCGFRYQPHLNFHVDTTTIDVVNNNLGKNRKRDIRVSLRDGAIIIEQPTLEQVKNFYAILKQLYQSKVRTPLYAWSFFELLYQLPSAHFLLIEYNGEIIGGTMCVELENKTMYEWFVCGDDGKYKNIYPSELATYAGLQYAAKHGCRRFDMMGAGVPDEHYGVRDFKARFGGKLVEQGRYLKISNLVLYKIGGLGVSAIKSMRIFKIIK